MTAQRTAPEGGNPRGRNDQVGAGSLSSVQAPTATDHTDTATTCCRICKRPLFTAKSCRLSIGPKCAHRIAASVVVPGFRVDAVTAADDGALTVVLVPVAVDA